MNQGKQRQFTYDVLQHGIDLSSYKLSNNLVEQGNVKMI
jgi:hypothetical protein